MAGRGRTKAHRSIRVLLMGYPYFATRFRELGAAAAGFTFWEIPPGRFQKWLALLRSDVIYLIGGDLRRNRYYRLALLLHKKVIMHWVGTDILEMKKLKAEGHSLSPLLIRHATHWAEVDWTVRELAELGVTAQTVPLSPAGFPGTVKDLPAKFVGLTYLPPGKESFYGADWIIRLAAEFPDIILLVAAASPQDKKEQWPANMIPIGWVNDMSELYGEITVLIRLTQHDGLSFMVLEALAQARHVIWSYSLPGAGSAGNYPELREQISRLHERFLAGKLEPNWEGRDMVMAHYSPQAVWERISAGIISLVAE